MYTPKDIKLVCEYILKEHAKLKQFTAGFGYDVSKDACHCGYCQAARRLLEGK